ncbi:unnamed protein product [Pylaiella littoralis]
MLALGVLCTAAAAAVATLPGAAGFAALPRAAVAAGDRATPGAASSSVRDGVRQHQAKSLPSRSGRRLFAAEGAGPSTVALKKKGEKVVKPWLTKAQETVDYSNVEAMYVRHILVQTEDMAKMCLGQIKQGADFAELASSISDCKATRDKGGEIGWASTPQGQRAEPTASSPLKSPQLSVPTSAAARVLPGQDEAGELSEVMADVEAGMDEILPREARTALLDYKPGDVVVTPTGLGWHVVKIDDVMTRLSATARKAASTRQAGAGLSTSSLRSLQGEGMPALSYFMETMGCQMNVADSERMEGQMADLGIDRTEDKEKASVFVLNTCSIRDHAEQKVYSYVGPYAIRKQKGENIAIVVAGCVAQQEGEKLLRRVPEIDLVMGPQYANRLGDLLEDVMNGNQIVATDPSLIMEDVSKPRRSSSTCAWVNIIYGCNEHCTYCVVPGVRGVEQSRPKESIRQEMVELAAAGYREVTLLGQNVDAYGRDMDPKHTFAELLNFVSDVPGIERVRFVTSHPRYMSLRVVDAVANLPSMAECFMVPFQSGDNQVLKNMRRGYTVESYMLIINRIKELAPDAAITGDVIVGFPGETEEQFQHTLDLMERVKFDNLNTFSYSPRPNTEAALWENQVPEDVKADRLQRVMRLGCTHAQERSERYMGRIEEVLVEERNPKNAAQVMGRTRTNRPVFLDGDITELKGKLIKAEITECRPWSLTGVAQGEPY